MVSKVKMLVEVDLSMPLICGASIRLEGDKRWVMFKYKQLPQFFFYCRMIGHRKRSEVKMKDAKNGNLNEGQFGDWLRATNGRISNKDIVTGAKNLNNRRLDSHKE